MKMLLLKALVAYKQKRAEGKPARLGICRICERPTLSPSRICPECESAATHLDKAAFTEYLRKVKKP